MINFNNFLEQLKLGDQIRAIENCRCVSLLPQYVEIVLQYEEKLRLIWENLAAANLSNWYFNNEAD